MCIIAYKPKNEKLPSQNVLKQCFESNPHGAGFMVARGGKVHIRKGYMTFDAFWSALCKMHPRTEEAIVMHFRIKSHGKINPSNCHPFPISNKDSELKSLSFNANTGLAHNGIISAVNPEGDMSDTMTFIKYVISTPNVFNNRKDDTIAWLIDEFVGTSKIILLNADGSAEFFGLSEKNWTKSEGVLFSNDTFKTHKIHRAGYVGTSSDKAETNINNNKLYELPTPPFQFQRGLFESSSATRSYPKTVKVQYLTHVCPECSRASVNVTGDGKAECQWCGPVELIAM